MHDVLEVLLHGCTLKIPMIIKYVVGIAKIQSPERLGPMSRKGNLETLGSPVWPKSTIKPPSVLS